jgi:hypothetical protein
MEREKELALRQLIGQGKTTMRVAECYDNRTVRLEEM